MSKQEPVAWIEQRFLNNELISQIATIHEMPEINKVNLAKHYELVIIPLTADYAESLRQQRDELLSALESIAEYWNRDANNDAMADACWHAIDIAEAAIAKVKEQEGASMSEERRYGPNAATFDEIDRGPYAANYREIDLVAHIRTLLADNAALQADAERYRWLRNQERAHIGNENGDWRMGSSLQEPEQLDALIDEAKKAEHG